MKDEFAEFLAPPGPIQKMNQTAEAAQLSTAVMREVPPPPPLHGQTIPPVINKRETPAHRVMLELSAQGFMNKEIAQMLGRTSVNVNNVLRQPALQHTLVEECRRQAEADQRVVEIIKLNVAAATQVLVDIARDDKAKNSDRIAAVNALLDRRYGKPNQPINRNSEVDLATLTIGEIAKQLPQN